MKNPVEDFKEAAERYCAWARAEWSSSDLSITLNLLTDVYSKARQLEGVEVNVSEYPTDFTVDVGPIKNFNHLISLFDPNDMEANPGVLIDDLIDTYKDLQLGLLLYESGEVDEAIWQWRDSYISHWGLHAVSAMKMLHDFVY